MKIRDAHPWNVSALEAKRIQEELRGQLELTPTLPLRDLKFVAGVDNGYLRNAADTTAYAAVVTLSFPALTTVDTTFGSAAVTFPYVPGLLSFRESPAILDAFSKITTEPDVVLFDAHGYSHFRRLGLASHLGVLLNRPTVGVAKTRLIGHCEEPPEEIGAFTLVVDKGEVVGAAVRTRLGHSPVFVSPGNRINLASAVAVVLATHRDQHFLPEPTRLAHQLITRYTRQQREGRIADGGQRK